MKDNVTRKIICKIADNSRNIVGFNEYFLIFLFPDERYVLIT